MQLRRDQGDPNLFKFSTYETSPMGWTKVSYNIVETRVLSSFPLLRSVHVTQGWN